MTMAVARAEKRALAVWVRMVLEEGQGDGEGGGSGRHVWMGGWEGWGY